MSSLPVPKFSLLDAVLSGVTIEQAVANIISYAVDGAKHFVCVFAVDSLLRCHDSAALREVQQAADMTLCDGMPLVFVGRKIARLPMNRCYGPDVMLKTIEAGVRGGLKHFFYGGKDADTVAKLEAALLEKFPEMKIAGHYIPPFRPLAPEEKADVVERINGSGADIVWVGTGTPKQDFWCAEFRPLLNAPVFVAVGAAFNFHAGTVAQAPRWMMRVGLEWLFRLLAEPRRLWRRYIIGNPRFLLLVLRQLITRKPHRLGERL